jgi:hypothetical protein
MRRSCWEWAHVKRLTRRSSCTKKWGGIAMSLSRLVLCLGQMPSHVFLACFPQRSPEPSYFRDGAFPAKVSLRFMVLFFVLVTYPNARNYQTSAQFNASYESISCVWSCSYKQTFLGAAIKSAILAMVLYSHSTM